MIRWLAGYGHAVQPGNRISTDPEVQRHAAPAEQLWPQDAIKWIRGRRKSEAILAESQRLARIGSFELDVSTLQLTWSEQQFRIFGFEPASTIARAQVITRIDPRDLPHHEAAVQRAIESGEPFAVDYRVVHPDGKVLHVHTVGEPVFNAAGRVAKIVGTTQDVTERVLLEEQLRAQCEQLKQLDALKTAFVDAVSHELRTPLTTILGYVEFLESEMGGPVTPEQGHFVHQIRRGAKRLDSLLDDLLDMACMEAGTFKLKLTRAEVGVPIREAVDSLRPRIDEAGLVLDLDLPDAPLELEMDARRVGQVFANLLANAIRFSPAGGTIQMRAFQCGPTLRCEVRDSGPGIGAADLPRLFQRFSQLDAGRHTGKGTGLGLSISKTLVEAHGGTIGVASTPDVGSTFWFELPLALPQPWSS